MSASLTKVLYIGTAVTAGVLLLTGVSVSAVLTVVFLAVMVGMHLGGHGGHGGHGGQPDRDGSTDEHGHAGHPPAPSSGAAQRER